MSTELVRVSPEPGRNLRACPALGGYIKPADCGAFRGSRIACPATCPHFPLGTAADGAASKVLDTTVDQWVRFLVQDLGPEPFRDLCWTSRFDDPDPDDADEDAAEEEALQSGLYHAALLCATERAPGAAAGVMARFAAAGHPGLNNDGRQMLRHLQQARVAWLEVERTTAEGELLCRELLLPEAGPLVLRDARMAATTARFSRWLTWIVPLPHGALPFGIGVEIRPEVWTPWQTAVAQRFATAQATDAARSWSEYLSRHLPELVRLEQGEFEAWSAATLAELRREHWFSEWRILTSAAELSDALRQEDALQEIEPGTVPGTDETPVAAFSWQTEDDAEQEPETFGELHVLTQSLVVEADTQQAHDAMRAWLEEAYDADLRLLEERHATVPPGAGETDCADDDPRGFLDEPHPELDGVAPRAAATRPELRPRLLDLVKRHLYALDTARLQGRAVADYAWVLDELDLTELR